MSLKPEEMEVAKSDSQQTQEQQEIGPAEASVEFVESKANTPELGTNKEQV